MIDGADNVTVKLSQRTATHRAESVLPLATEPGREALLAAGAGGSMTVTDP